MIPKKTLILPGIEIPWVDPRVETNMGLLRQDVIVGEPSEFAREVKEAEWDLFIRLPLLCVLITPCRADYSAHDGQMLVCKATEQLILMECRREG